VLILITALPLGLVAAVLGAQAWRSRRQANAARARPRVTGWVTTQASVRRSTCAPAGVRAYWGS
jgi:hypothetical protein